MVSRLSRARHLLWRRVAMSGFRLFLDLGQAGVRVQAQECLLSLRVFGCLQSLREGLHGGRRPKSLEGGNQGE